MDEEYEWIEGADADADVGKGDGEGVVAVSAACLRCAAEAARSKI